MVLGNDKENFVSYNDITIAAILLYKQGPIRHKPWPIQTVKKFQDSCRLSSQLQSMSQSVS